MKLHYRRKRIISMIVIIGLVMVILFSGLQILESVVVQKREETAMPSKTIVRDGIAYYPRQDITVVMVLGIDQYGAVVSSGVYNNPGASDVVMLLILDESNETCSVLTLNRDTMVEMPVLGVGGKQAGTVYQQLALAHTYGTGLEDSCENTRTTVSQMLGGITIDHYISMNMDAVAILNDAVGGVTVNVADDFSQIDPTITQGEVTLRGEQALHFIRTRKDVGDQLNVTRMERQREYMNGWTSSFKIRLEQNPEFLLTAYEDVSDYVVTDCSVNVLTDMMERYAEYSLDTIVTPEGDNVKGEKYYEFYADEEKLKDLALELFYAEK